MTYFDICHTLVKISRLSTLLYSELYFKQPESVIYQKMPILEQLKNQVLVV